MKRKTIAVIGGIGSGKSQVRHILAEAGYNTLDCDKIARDVSNQPQVLSAVKDLLGDKALLPDGTLNRRYIRSVVFADPDITNRYTAIFSQAVKDALGDALARLDGTVFVEVSVADSFRYKWDERWFVRAPDETRIKRVTSRDKVSIKNVLEIMARQSSDKYLGDVVIDNDGTLEELKVKVLAAAENETKSVPND